MQSVQRILRRATWRRSWAVTCLTEIGDAGQYETVGHAPTARLPSCVAVGSEGTSTAGKRIGEMMVLAQERVR